MDRPAASRHARTRRHVLRALGAGAVVGSSAFRAVAAEKVTLPFANGERPLVQFPQKRPLIVVTMRPPQLETPFDVFNENVVTPNDAFFVRYHLANVPTAIDPASYRLTVKGLVKSPLSLSLAELKSLAQRTVHSRLQTCRQRQRAITSWRSATRSAKRAVHR